MEIPGYTGVRVLGSGGFGEVVLARHDDSGTPVTIKYLRRHLLADAEFAALFRAEAALVVLQGSLLGLAAAPRRGVVHREPGQPGC